MDKFSKFIPLQKIEEQSDGSLYVFGLVTEQKPDLDKEVCDYDGTKPRYEKRTQERYEFTKSIEGMTPSLMPMRQMHALKSIGAGRDIHFDDAQKTIRMGFHVVEPEAVKLWKAGVFIGFSQGGDYVKKWPDPDFKGCTRYIADPQEVSAVDSPCLPSALVESMKGKTYEMQKSSGTVEVKEFSVPEADELRFQKMERDLEVLKRTFTADERRHDARTGAAEPDGSFPIHDAKDLENAIHDVGRSKDPERAKRHIEERARALGLTDKLPEGWGKADKADGGNMAEKITDAAGFKKAAKSLHEHLTALKELHESHHEKERGHIEKCMKACGSMEEGEEGEKEEKAATPAVTKANDSELAKQVAELTALVKGLTDKLAKTPETPAAASGAIADDFKKASGFMMDEGSPSEGYVPEGFGAGEVQKAVKDAREKVVVI